MKRVSFTKDTSKCDQNHARTIRLSPINFVRMKKGIVVAGMMLMSAISVLYAGENPRSNVPVNENFTMVYSEPGLSVESWMLEIFVPASSVSEVVPVESWMLSTEEFMGDIPFEPAQEVETWMLGVYSQNLPFIQEEPIAIEPWMLKTDWL